MLRQLCLIPGLKSQAGKVANSLSHVEVESLLVIALQAAGGSMPITELGGTAGKQVDRGVNWSLYSNKCGSLRVRPLRLVALTGHSSLDTLTVLVAHSDPLTTSFTT